MRHGHGGSVRILLLATLAFGWATVSAGQTAAPLSSAGDRVQLADAQPAAPPAKPGIEAKPPTSGPTRVTVPGAAQPMSPITPPPAGAAQPQQLASLFGPTAPNEPFYRLAATPNMFGDSLGPGFDLAITDLQTGSLLATADLPLAGMASRTKVAEDNKALPQDRIHFFYNHFQNALDFVPGASLAGVAPQSLSVERYTLGVEKTFLDRLWSVELRMPLAGRSDLDLPALGVTGGSVGNLAVLVKRVIFESPTSVACLGLSIDTPTGSDVDVRFSTTELTLRNQATHLGPYIGFLHAPNERFFWQGFLQVDVPAGGDPVDFADQIAGSGRAGVLDEQTLLYADLSAGCWLYRNPCARTLTGLASIAELHYTTTLDNADTVSIATPRSRLDLGSLANRMDVVDLTVGLHAQLWGNAACRVAGVFPITQDDRFFDAEVQVQIERRF